ARVARAREAAAGNERLRRHDHGLRRVRPRGVAGPVPRAARVARRRDRASRAVGGTGMQPLQITSEPTFLEGPVWCPGPGASRGSLGVTDVALGAWHRADVAAGAPPT